MSIKFNTEAYTIQINEAQRNYIERALKHYAESDHPEHTIESLADITILETLFRELPASHKDTINDLGVRAAYNMVYGFCL